VSSYRTKIKALKLNVTSGNYKTAVVVGTQTKFTLVYPIFNTAPPASKKTMLDLKVVKINPKIIILLR